MRCGKAVTSHFSSRAITFPRDRKVIHICLLPALAVLAGCATQVPSPYPDVTSLLNAPPPQDRQEQAQRCIYLHQEILLQRNKEDAASIMLPNTTLLSAQQEASRNIAALKAKSADLGCDTPTYAPNQPATTKDIGDYIDVCMAKCKQYTSRTPEQCFDSCKFIPK
jgi:hypothetical protein